MKIVNKSNIPDSLFRYLSQDLYDYTKKGDSFSVTEILNPTQIVLLKRKHFKEIEVDAIDQLWKLLGSGVHAILENEKGIEKIERLKWEIDGITISGRWDRIFENKITDYKVTSAFTIVYGSRLEEWTMQLSMYRWLYFKNKGILLENDGYIVALLRDWAQRNVKPTGSYPKSPAVEIKLKLASIEETESFIISRVKEIKKAMASGRSPNCTDSERWYNNEKKVYGRCAKYCEASKFCPQLEAEQGREKVLEAEFL